MNDAWTLEIDSDWIAWLTFDVPGKSVNTFDTSTMRELDARLDELAGNESIKAVAIRSGKASSFIVGADIDELASIDDAEDARAKSEAGHALFGKIAALPVPVVVVVHGACLGGGLEMALACDYRLATDDPGTSLGLPEVKLGILPGWGGTQRLPRLVGMIAALGIILPGRSVNARKARRIGLVDGIVAASFQTGATRAFIDKITTTAGRRKVARARRRTRSRITRLLEGTRLGRRFIVRRAGRDVRAKTNGLYPAPLEALDVVRRTYRRRPLEEGLRIEAEAFTRLACGPISRNLVWIFQASQRMKKSPGVAASRPVRAAGVVGAGIMGSGIAWALSRAEIPVRLRDVSWEAAAAGVKRAADIYRSAVKRRRMTEGQMNLAMHRIMPGVDATGFAGLDVVVEAVAENIDIKRAVLADIEANVPSDALICTNTSSLSLRDLASGLRNPKRFVGLHFFNPVNRMNLVEVVPGPRTSKASVVAAVDLVRRLGKLPVVVGDCPGFLVNRILLPYLVECAWMLEEGVETRRLDGVLERFGMPMGPLTLADEVGLDIGFHAAKALESAYGSRMQVAGILDDVVARGLRGRKSGAGFYRYRGRRKSPNPDMQGLIEIARERDGVPQESLTDDDIVDRAVLVMVNEAARCLDEHVIDGPETLDMAMVMGTGFAPFRGGLLRYADDRGIELIADRLSDLAVAFGDRFEPAPMLRRLADDDRDFYDGRRARGARR